MEFSKEYVALIAARLDKHSIPEPNSGCFLWLGYVHPVTGYGLLSVQIAKKTVPRVAHRLAWVVKHGSVPDDKHCCHRCDNRLCVNADHLWLGDDAANMADKVAKGRQTQGEGHPRATTSLEMIRAIFLDPRSRKIIAAAHDVDYSIVVDVKLRRRWRVATSHLISPHE